MITQYTTTYSSPPADVIAIINNKCHLLDSYIVMQTGQYQYSAIIFNNATKKGKQYTFTRTTGTNNYYTVTSTDVSSFDYNVYNEYYVYSNDGIGKPIDLMVYQGVTSHAVVICCVMMMFVVVFKGGVIQMSKIKKGLKLFIPFIMLLLLLIPSVSVSAVSNGGCTVNLVLDQVSVKYGSTTGAINTELPSTFRRYVQNTDSLSYIMVSFLNGMSANHPSNAKYFMWFIPFSLSCDSSYGTLKFHIETVNERDGQYFQESSFNGLFTTDNKKISDFTISDYHNGSISYEGVIPSSGYFQFKTFAPLVDTMSLNITMTYQVGDDLNREQSEANKQGQGSVDDVSSSVPNYGDGLLGSLQSLNSAISYTGTEAKWKMPQLYIPAISGVCDRINLTDEMDIDLGFWCQKIPDTILKVIQYLGSIGLVIFAVKELYGLISYVLTLRKGGGNE